MALHIKISYLMYKNATFDIITFSTISSTTISIFQLLVCHQTVSNCYQCVQFLFGFNQLPKFFNNIIASKVSQFMFFVTTFTLQKSFYLFQRGGRPFAILSSYDQGRNARIFLLFFLFFCFFRFLSFLSLNFSYAAFFLVLEYNIELYFTLFLNF